ncbi:IclR family transcriptional regulator [Brevibacterium atlanticum]|uniref:IclR family transcriptional regulator n=1 Tax=Brevibacterium atlanticum TaxID=2697563 RepID=UPI0014213CAC|nr:IclR family transcriptional regulator [Brevibacterium atlanticum]
MPKQKTTDESTGRGASVIENTVAILRCFSPDRQELGVTEIAPQVGLHKSSVSRILASLEREGIVEQTASRRYRLGLGIIAIAGPLLADLDVRRVSYSAMQELTEETGETSALMVWNGTESITVEQIPSAHEIKHTSSLGSRYSTAYSASVQVFLAAEDAERVRELIDDGSIVNVGSGIHSVEDYRARLADVVDRGCAINYGETSADAVGIAAPIRDHRDEIVAAILVPAPKYRVDEVALEKLTKSCMKAANQVTRRLGGA